MVTPPGALTTSLLVDRLRKMFHEADMLPTEKLDMPITTSHEIGWDATRVGARRAPQVPSLA